MSSKQHVASTILWTPSKGGIVTAVELRIHCIHFYISAFLSLYVLDFHHTAYIFSHSLSFSLFKSLSKRHVRLITLYRVRLHSSLFYKQPFYKQPGSNS